MLSTVSHLRKKNMLIRTRVVSYMTVCFAGGAVVTPFGCVHGTFLAFGLAASFRLSLIDWRRISAGVVLFTGSLISPVGALLMWRDLI
jgi:hypothetical protein